MDRLATKTARIDHIKMSIRWVHLPSAKQVMKTRQLRTYAIMRNDKPKYLHLMPNRSKPLAARFDD